MAVITRVYHWEGNYTLDWRTLPLEGLATLRHELRMDHAKRGINFDEEYLLEDVEKEIKKRVDAATDES